MKRLLLALAILVPVAAAQADADTRGADSTFKARKGDQRMVIQTGRLPTSFTSTSFTQLTATTPLAIPAGQSGFLVVTFTGESECTGPSSSWCSVQLTCDTIPLEPASGTDFAFSSGGQEERVSASMVGRSDVVAGGTSHACAVESAVVAGATEHVLDDWTLTVEFWRQQ